MPVSDFYNVWLTDRSRYKAGMECAMKRYLEYHAGPYGYGYKKIGASLPLTTGTFVHEPLANVLLHAQGAQAFDSPASIEQARPLLRQLITKPIKEKYLKMIADHGFLDDNAQEAVPGQTQHTMMEQATLQEGLAWAWVKVMLPIILDEYEIVCVEHEETVALDPEGRLIQMSKPDIILRRKSDGALTNHDFKTTATISDDTPEQYRNDVQMMVGSMGTEARLGEPVNQYYIHALLKGSRGKFKLKGNVEPFKKQYSDLCYAKVVPANPPFQDYTTFDFGGFWIQKEAVWQMTIPGKPEGWSNVEYLVSVMPTEKLYELFQILGPYSINRASVKQYTIHVIGEENRWIQNLTDLAQAEEQHGWTSLEFQTKLDSTIPRSYNCYSWGGRCPYYQICYFGDGVWNDPVGSGAYQYRRSHHEPEIEQMTSRGIPVPPEAWEEGE